MKAIVRYEFNNQSFFPENFQGEKSIKLFDPPIIPATGDSVHINMKEFFDDAELLLNYEAHCEGQVFFSERLNTIVGKNEIEVVIVLFEEIVFQKYFPRFFRDEVMA